MHFLRHGVQGIDVTHLSDKVIAFSSDPPNSTYKVMRDGAFVSQVPTVVGPVSVSFLSNLDFLNKNSGTSRAVVLQGVPEGPVRQPSTCEVHSAWSHDSHGRFFQQVAFCSSCFN